MGGEFGGEWMGVYVWLNPFVVHLKLSQYFKSAMWSESESHSVVSNSLWPHGLYSSWNPPGQNTRVSSLSLLQGNLPYPGIKPGSPALQADSFPTELIRKRLFVVFHNLFSQSVIISCLLTDLLVKKFPVFFQYQWSSLGDPLCLHFSVSICWLALPISYIKVQTP